MLSKLATTAAAALVVGLLASAGAATAAEDGHHATDANRPDVAWHHEGLFGTFDRASLQRGFQVYQNVCQGCHGLKYLAFRNLEALGYGEEEVKAIAAQYTVMDGPNDSGEMFERPARPSDRKPGPYANEQEARAANGGALPPDLSLIIKAREGGEDHTYAVLTGYQDPPEGVEPREGLYYNPAFQGGWIAMPPPLQPDQVAYGDNTPATVDQMSQDVTQFLTWIAEPNLEQRKQTGVKAVLFLIILTALLFAYKRQVWREVH